MEVIYKVGESEGLDVIVKEINTNIDYSNFLVSEIMRMANVSTDKWIEFRKELKLFKFVDVTKGDVGLTLNRVEEVITISEEDYKKLGLKESNTLPEITKEGITKIKGDFTA